MNQKAYLRRRLGESIKQKRKEIRSLPSSVSSEFVQEKKMRMSTILVFHLVKRNP